MLILGVASTYVEQYIEFGLKRFGNAMVPEADLHIIIFRQEIERWVVQH